MHLDAVTTQVLWQRLVSIVDEAAVGLMRTAYTPSVKEYHDFCCALFDRSGDMLAHSTVTTAGFLGIVPEVMRNFLKAHPAETLNEGDTLITNDPWLASGHLIDITVAQPIMHRGSIVGFALCIVHHLDMGGRMATLESKNMYEEGLKIPVLKLYDRGVLNEAIYAFLRANIRVPEKVLGDLRAQLVANFVCADRLVHMLDEYELDGLEELSREIIERTESSLRQKISALPDGIYRNQVTLPKIPGTDEAVVVNAAVTIDGDSITIDYDGSSGEVGAAINCTLNMTRSYTTYPIKLALDPDVPNNEGGLRPIIVRAPEGGALNCSPPAATWGRTMISHLLPEIIFQAIEDILPQGGLAGNGGCPANEVYVHGRKPDGTAFMAIAQHSGGFGGSSRHDGYATLCFPNNTANIPVEVTEAESTILYLKKELVTDSAGPGRNRGGLGQEIAFRILETEGGHVDASIRLNGRSEESSFPIRGRRGGQPGRGAGLWIDERPAEHGSTRRMRTGQVARFRLGGGGGYGDPMEREAWRVARDVREGYVSAEAALRDYGVAVAGDGSVDAAATARARSSQQARKAG